MGNCVSRKQLRPVRTSVNTQSIGVNDESNFPCSSVEGIDPSVSASSAARKHPTYSTMSWHPPDTALDNKQQLLSDAVLTNTTPQRADFSCSDSECRSYSGKMDSNHLSKEYLNGGYWASWKYYDGLYPSSVPVDKITHVHYAFADIDGDGTVYLADEYVHYEAEVDGVNGCLRAWTQRKKENPDLKITLAIGGSGRENAERFADVAADSQKLLNFIESTKILVEKFHLDGIDIDWEHPTGPDQARNYLQMLVSLREALGLHTWVTTALPAGQWALRGLNMVQIANTVDFINLMAYDFVASTYAHVSETGHHAKLYPTDVERRNGLGICGADAVATLVDGKIPSRKLVLGVPLYGRLFDGADGPGQPFQDNGCEVAYEIRFLPPPDMTEVYDNNVVAASSHGHGKFITYDNNDSVKAKAEFAQLQNLRGLFYWHLAGDKIGDSSLVAAGHDALKTSSLSTTNGSYGYHRWVTGRRVLE